MNTAHPSAPLPSRAAASALPSAAPTSLRRFRHRNEAARGRDVLRYLCAWERTHKPVALRRNAFPKDQSTPAPQLCPDKALTAFAQLCTLRMNVQTCLLTLCNSTTEFVLADVSQSTPFQCAAGARAEDSTWIGTTSFDKSGGITGEALVEWQRARRARSPALEDGHYHTQGLTQHSLVISDVRTDQNWRKKELFRRGPWIRFVCSVPVRSGQGSVIGSLTLLDNKPRYGISDAELLLLEDLSDTIVEHLHSTVVRVQQERSQRLLQGLSAFNKGEASLREWWLAHDDMRVNNKGRNTDRGTAQDRTDRVDFEFGTRRISNASDVPAQEGRPEHASLADGVDGLDRSQEQHQTSRPLNGGDSTSSSPSLGAAAEEARKPDGFDPAVATPAAYSRASNLVREALGIDGAAFMSSNFAISSSERDTPVADFSSVDESGDSNGDTDCNTRMCGVHGYSVRAASTANDQHAQTGIFGIPVAHLRRLVKRYPHGAVFYFGEDGKVETSSDDSHSGPSGSSDAGAKKHRRMRKEAEALGKVFEGIRSAAIHPLWDEANERWRSCLFVYSTTEARTLDREEDLAYLRTFSHSLSVELSRLESVAADQAKTTFISSISHELRSPLHGILAGVEFLNETELNAFQMEMTETINAAGRVLLDTVDHILTHSKMSAITRASKTSTKAESPDSPLYVDSEQTSAATDLAQLTERSQALPTSMSHNTANHKRVPSYPASASSTADASKVAITLNIVPQKQWKTNISPGAWTRILTNLVGNALKYTREGHISVRLDVLSDTESDQAFFRSTISLIVEDTGIGMSDSFLANDVFVPFKQEDPYTTGTGLGLSIVKQIATSLNGELHISSKKGRGTRISLRVPVIFMKEDDHVTAHGNRPNPVVSVTASRRSDHFRLLTLPPTLADSRSSTERDLDGTSAVGQSVMMNVEQWLGCKVSSGSTRMELESDAEDIVIYAVTEHMLMVWNSVDPGSLSEMLEQLSLSNPHLVILADNIRSMSPNRSLAGLPLTPVFVHQPIGPRKLLHAIMSDRNSTMIDQSPDLDNVEDRLRGGSSNINTPLDFGHASDSMQSASLISGNPFDRWAAGNRAVVSKGSTASVTSTGRRTTSYPVTEKTLSTSTAEACTDQEESWLADRSAVLLVEDNEINMKLLTTLLRKLKLPYRCANNGREAINIVRRMPRAFMIALMDLNMPIVDGFTATAKIREYETKHNITPRMYISALTGVTDENSKVRAFDSGVDDFFSKPVRMKELKIILEKVTSSRSDVAAEVDGDDG